MSMGLSPASSFPRFMPTLVSGVYLCFRDGQYLSAQINEPLMSRSVWRHWRIMFVLASHWSFRFLPRLSCGCAALVRSTFQHVFASKLTICQALANYSRSGICEPLG